MSYFSPNTTFNCPYLKIDMCNSFPVLVDHIILYEIQVKLCCSTFQIIFNDNPLFVSISNQLGLFMEA